METSKKRNLDGLIGFFLFILFFWPQSPSVPLCHHNRLISIPACSGSGSANSNCRRKFRQSELIVIKFSVRHLFFFFLSGSTPGAIIRRALLLSRARGGVGAVGGKRYFHIAEHQGRRSHFSGEKLIRHNKAGGRGQPARPKR